METQKNTVIVGIFVVLVVLGLVLSACEEEEKEIECGELIVNNLPTSKPWSGAVYFDQDITSRWGMVLFSRVNADTDQVAEFKKPGWEKPYIKQSPFPLRDPDDALKGFLKTGTYLVIVWPEGTGLNSTNYDCAFMSVAFNKGKATIDYNDMTRRESLPEYDD